MQTVETKLQQCLNRVQTWTSKNGFKFSLITTKVMQFTCLPGLHNQPTLRLGDAMLPYTDKIKFLELIWDTKLIWKEHIAKFRGDCSKLIGLLKTITNQKWESYQFCTTKIYQLYIRSKLYYGAPVYGSASKTSLQQLDTITTESLRIGTSAFRTTPTETLHVLASEMKARFRRDYPAFRYYYNIKSQTSNPARTYLISLTYRDLFSTFLLSFSWCSLPFVKSSC